MEYLIYSMKYGNCWHHYLWYNTEDGPAFLMKENKICDFVSVGEALAYGRQEQISIGAEQTKIIIRGGMDQSDGVYYFDVWNLVTDFCNTLKTAFWGNNGDPETERIYRKLFRANTANTAVPEGGTRPLMIDETEHRLMKILYTGFLEVIDEVVASRSVRMGQQRSSPGVQTAQTVQPAAGSAGFVQDNYYDVHKRLRIKDGK